MQGDMATSILSLPQLGYQCCSCSQAIASPAWSWGWGERDTELCISSTKRQPCKLTVLRRRVVSPRSS